MKMNRKGQTGTQVMVFPFFFLILIIGGGIAISVLIYFGTGYDIKQVESQILNYNLKDCLTKSNFIDLQNNLFSSCNLNKNSIENRSIIIKICQDLSIDDCVSSSTYLFSIGGSVESCFLKGADSNPNYPKCFSQNLIIQNRNITIITGSNQVLRVANA